MNEKIRNIFAKSKGSKPEIQPGPSKSILSGGLQDITPANPVVNPEPYSYHHAKEVIENEINDFKQEAGEQIFPEITFERKQEETQISFEIPKEADLYKTVSLLSVTLGELNIRTFMPGNMYLGKDNLGIYLSEGMFGGKNIRFSSKKDLTDQEIESIIKTYKLANSGKEKAEKDPRQKLAELGATIYDPEKAPGWDYLAGYPTQKQKVKEDIINSFLHPEVYEEIAKATRKNYESNCPKAVLFEGPPGTGKTTMARIIAGQITAPLIYVPIESIMTKWYGESERNLAQVFNAAGQFGGAIIFLDEIDSLSTSRDNNLHEATRRILSVLLRKIDGLTPTENIILIGATNRKIDLDSALISRFNDSINFPLPNEEERQAIFNGYAQHLSKEDLILIAKKSDGYSGRDIKNLCERAERNWASKMISHETELTLPTASHYLTLLYL